jgi:hypothetical protein
VSIGRFYLRSISVIAIGIGPRFKNHNLEENLSVSLVVQGKRFPGVFFEEESASGELILAFGSPVIAKNLQLN